MTPIETKDSLEDLLRGLYRDTGVLVERQSEVNRRLGVLESKVDRILALEGTVADLEASNEKRGTWRDWGIQSILAPALSLVAVWAAYKLGVPIVGGP